jgi:hypothetical protein
MKQTAIEFLMDKLFDPTFDNKKQIEWFEQAKEMEKQQIIDAHIKGHNAPSSTIKNYDAEQYYNEQFNKK